MENGVKARYHQRAINSVDSYKMIMDEPKMTIGGMLASGVAKAARTRIIM